MVGTCGTEIKKNDVVILIVLCYCNAVATVIQPRTTCPNNIGVPLRCSKCYYRAVSATDHQSFSCVHHYLNALPLLESHHIEQYH